MGIFKTVNSEIKMALIQIPKLWILLSKRSLLENFLAAGFGTDGGVIGGGLTEKIF